MPRSRRATQECLLGVLRDTFPLSQSKSIASIVEDTISNLSKDRRRDLEELFQIASEQFKETLLDVVDACAGSARNKTVQMLSDFSQEEQKRIVAMWLEALAHIYRAKQYVSELLDERQETLQEWSEAQHRHHASSFSEPPYIDRIRDAIITSGAVAVDRPALYRAVILRLKPFWKELTAEFIAIEAIEEREERMKQEQGDRFFKERPQGRIGESLNELGKEKIQKNLSYDDLEGSQHSRYTRNVVRNPEFLKQDSSRVIVHNITQRAVEIYEVRITEDRFTGMAKKVQQLGGIEKLPKYVRGKRRKFYTDGCELKQAPDNEQGWPKLKSRRSRYQPVTLENSFSEQDVTRILAKEGIVGGWWKTLLNGQVPTPDISAEGFRSASLIFALAGLGRWVDWKQKTKAVSWMRFPDAILGNGRCLTLGTCHFGSNIAPAGCWPTWRADSSQRLDVWAFEESPYWEQPLMWG